MDRPPGAGYIRSVMTSRNLLACLLCLVGMVAFPAAALAQTAGDTEYGGVAAANATSPATPTPPASGTAGETTQGTAPATTPTATAKADTAQVAGETASGTLPFTGRDILLMLLVGAGLVGLGVVLRVASRRAPAGA